MNKRISILLASLALAMPAYANSEMPMFQTVEHNGYKVIMDCVTKSPLLFQFRIGKDVWNERAREHFDFDPKVSRSCQQTSTKKYGRREGTKYLKGHLVGTEAMDNMSVTMDEAYFLSNAVPQASEFDTGAWKVTELYQECFRESSDILVVGGVAYNNDENDFFIRSHGIKTPDIFWKLIVTGEGYYAWMFPNSDEATATKTNSYLTTVSTIEGLIGFDLGIRNAMPLPVSSLPKDPVKCL